MRTPTSLKASSVLLLVYAICFPTCQNVNHALLELAALALVVDK
jgi:hypothetical protein